MGLIAHMDTSPDAPGAGVKPRVVRYEGGDLVLNEEKGIVMRAAEFESLAKYKGQELIVTDGTTLLGADDKAGVAEIMSAVEYLLQHPELPHGRIAVGFTPDEEVGQGADHFDVEGVRELQRGQRGRVLPRGEHPPRLGQEQDEERNPDRFGVRGDAAPGGDPRPHRGV